MSNEQAKVKHSSRIHKNETAINKQVKIAKLHKGQTIEPHRYKKHHALDCGNPHCFLCGNPRKTHKDRLTAQEKRMFQDTENQTIYTNGILPKD